MARVPLIAGNWKMNTTFEEAEALVRAMLPELEQVSGVEKVVCPPFPWLPAVAALARGSSVAVGAQNMYFQDSGAFTGEVSPLMLKGLCDYVILGHSERRIHFRETEWLINQKVLAAVRHGLKPILCVGENADQREHNEAGAVVGHQLEVALKEVAPDPTMIVAYEPVWAIGTGAPATPEDANEMCQFIREQLARLFSDEPARAIRVLYGGSVTAQNIAGFVEQPEIDGALVGGASLRAADFEAIVRTTAESARAKGPS